MAVIEQLLSNRNRISLTNNYSDWSVGEATLQSVKQVCDGRGVVANIKHSGDSAADREETERDRVRFNAESKTRNDPGRAGKRKGRASTHTRSWRVWQRGKATRTQTRTQNTNTNTRHLEYAAGAYVHGANSHVLTVCYWTHPSTVISSCCMRHGRDDDTPACTLAGDRGTPRPLRVLRAISATW